MTTFLTLFAVPAFDTVVPVSMLIEMLVDHRTKPKRISETY